MNNQTTPAVARLQELLGEPPCWGWARPQLWAAAEKHLGLTLPTDYKAFLDLYGPGSFDHLLWLGRPVHGTQAEMEQIWSVSGRPHLDDPERTPFPFHPHPGGLIQWGGDHDGTLYYSLPEEENPDDWRVVVETEEGEWHEAPGRFTEFLLSCVEGPHRPPFLRHFRPSRTLHYYPQSQDSQSHPW
ncbi:SMI1/KNR4 family protein [Streptomyces sp. NPDC059193]|uniref:SMI1/KNR4 family protein n=1 Tax=Streptomyces sp. NPDC059193 TaxID=3346763 RepID=UPI00369C87B5